jgi:SulP family sulfate permease
VEGIRIVRIDAALSFVNATQVKKLLLGLAEAGPPTALVVDASGINDLDATGADMLREVITELDERHVPLHLTDVKGPVRDVLRRAGIWDGLGARIHTSTNDAVESISGQRSAPADQRLLGIDERPVPLDVPGATQDAAHV